MRRQNLEYASVSPAPISYLDATILERMKTDHYHPSALRQQRRSSFEHILEFSDLVINGDPNRLEGLRGRMNAPPMRSGDGAFHRRRKLRRVSDRPPPNNGSSDSSAPPFLAMTKNQIRKPFLVIGVDDLIRSQPLALIDSHVQGTFPLKTESSVRRLEMAPRQSQIRHDALKRFAARHFVNIAVAGL
jgi:hypothetical protein